MLKFLLLVVLCSGVVKSQDVPSVDLVDQGTVVGTTVVDGDFEYVQYLGVPYAGSTAGSHRFKAPTPPPVFVNDFIANRDNIKCIRPTADGFEGTEDCLVANVYVPATITTNVPVMVWIKGSEFDSNDNSLSFRYLIEQEVIVVTLNYRESIFGFLCLGVEEAPGNAGLKDIIAGLRWIQRNIAAFGGDPTSVTLFGHGSGAALVDFITLSPLSQGLVHRAIAQSGSSSAPWALSYDPRMNAITVAEKLGHIVEDEVTLAEIFQRASVSVLVAAIKELELTDNSLPFAVCLENQEADNEWVITEPPLDHILNGSFNQIPYITGFVQNEGTIRAQEALEYGWLQKMEESFVDFIQQDLHSQTINEQQALAEDIRDYYFQGRAVDMTSLADFIRFHGDTMILISAIRNARMRAATSEAPVYLYQFSYEGVLGQPFVGPFSVEGAAHGEDLAYLFDTGVTTEPDSSDFIVRNILIQRWTNFAKTGNPSSEINPEVQWSPITSEMTNFLHIFNNANEDINEAEQIYEAALVSPHEQRVSFWDNIYTEHYREITPVWEVDARDDEDEETVVVPEGGTDGGGGGGGETEEVGVVEVPEEEDTTGDATRIGAFLFSVLASICLVITVN